MSKSLEGHWRDVVAIGGAVIVLTGLLAVFFAKQQVDLVSKQLEYEQSQHPRLVYSVQLVASGEDVNPLSDAVNQLTESFYHQVYQYTQTHPEATYAKAVFAVLPMTATLHARPISAITRIENMGFATATRVRATLTMDQLITSFEVRSLEPYSVINGGVGQDHLTAEVHRIVSGDAVTITMGTQKELDQIVLVKPEEDYTIPYTTTRVITSELNLAVKSRTPIVDCISFSPYNCPITRYSPLIVFLPADEPTVDVVVRSDQGPGVPLPTPAP